MKNDKLVAAVPQKGAQSWHIALIAAAMALASCSSSDKCEKDLDEVDGHCPRTFAGTMADLPVCSLPAIQRVATCGNLIGLDLGNGGFGGTICYYDSSSHALVGASVSSDVTFACGDISEHGGSVPEDESCWRTPSFTRDCSKAADSGAE